MKNIIFDLDLTLADTSIADLPRKQRNWSYVYSLIPQFTLYEGMEDVFSFIRQNAIKVCIVSMAPRPYIQKVINHFNIPCDFIVGFHDTARKKPYPDPMLKALDIMGENSVNVVSFGDRSIDITSSNSADIKSAACTWGTNELTTLKKSNPTYIIDNPIEIIDILKSNN